MMEAEQERQSAVASLSLIQSIPRLPFPAEEKFNKTISLRRRFFIEGREEEEVEGEQMEMIGTASCVARLLFESVCACRF